MTLNRSGLYRVGTPEKARKILSKLLKDGKITIQDIDQESPAASYLREISNKYSPKIKLKPHVNLLRTNETEQGIKVNERRELPPTPRSESSISRRGSRLLLQNPQKDNTSINIENLPW